MIEFDLDKALHGGYEWGSICQSLEEELVAAKAAGNGALSDQIWRQEQIFKIWKGYDDVYHYLLDKKYYDAWCLVEEVLINIMYLLRNFPDDLKNVEFVRSHLLSIQTLFPYRVFFSTVIEVIEECCSICGSKISPWSCCGHIPGKLYDGELCMKVVKNFRFLGADIVSDPEHKYAVPFFKDESGNVIDHYDYSLVECLVRCWKNPFQDWRVSRKELFQSPPSDIKDADPCPCNLFLKDYAHCCKNRQGILSYEFKIIA